MLTMLSPGAPDWTSSEGEMSVPWLAPDWDYFLWDTLTVKETTNRSLYLFGLNCDYRWLWSAICCTHFYRINCYPTYLQNLLWNIKKIIRIKRWVKIFKTVQGFKLKKRSANPLKICRSGWEIDLNLKNQLVRSSILLHNKIYLFMLQTALLGLLCNANADLIKQALNNLAGKYSTSKNKSMELLFTQIIECCNSRWFDRCHTPWK